MKNSGNKLKKSCSLYIFIENNFSYRIFASTVATIVPQLPAARRLAAELRKNSVSV